MKTLATLVLALFTGVAASVALSQNANPPAAQQTAWVCPMHPDYTMETEGKCPRCGMALVRGAPFDVRDYRLDLQTAPPVVKPGERATLRLRISHPGTGEVIRRFEVVHEKQYHLFVIGRDMDHFEHVHPEQQADGTWTIDVTLPKAGYYKVLSDFVPGGGAAQFLPRPLVTAGYEGDLVGDSARLVPDAVLTKTVDDVTATLSYDPATFVAGLYGHLSFRLTDTPTGRPISDLQPYLGAFGHTLIASEGVASLETLLAAVIGDSVSPAICINPDCSFTTEMEPDQDRGWCDECRTNTVVAAPVLAASSDERAP